MTVAAKATSSDIVQSRIDEYQKPEITIKGRQRKEYSREIPQKHNQRN